MELEIIKLLNQFFHDMAIEELKKAAKKNQHQPLSYHDTLYLNIISAHPNQYTSSHIADLLQVSRPSVTQKIQELVKKGYVLRTQSKSDKRMHYLSIHPLNDYYSEAHLQKEIKTLRHLFEIYGEEEVTKAFAILSHFSAEAYNGMETSHE